MLENMKGSIGPRVKITDTFAPQNVSANQRALVASLPAAEAPRARCLYGANVDKISD